MIYFSRIMGKEEETKEVDIYRDTLLRYAGYANEVGEAFRALVPVNFVYASYGVASAYVLADTFDKSSKAKKQLGNTEGAMTKVGVAAFDTLVWQALASVIIPGLLSSYLHSVKMTKFYSHDFLTFFPLFRLYHQQNLCCIFIHTG